MTTWRGKIRPERRGCLPQEERDRPMFTRLALIALTGMSGRLLRRPRSRARRREMPSATATTASGKSTRQETAAQTLPSPPAAATAAVGDRAPHVRSRGNAPVPAAIAARSLPVLGVIGTLVTVVLAAGAVRGELPFI